MGLVHETLMKPFVQLVGPMDINSTGKSSIWVSLADYRGGVIYISVGSAAGAASAVTINQATDNSGSGSKYLDFDNHYQNGQRIVIGTVVGSFVLDETGTYDSTDTCKIRKISSDELVVTPLTGDTTQVNAETITGAGGATAIVSGTGTDEDIMVKLTTTSYTFDTLALTFKTYAIAIDNTMLDVANGFDHFQLAMADPSSSTIVSAIFLPSDPRISKYPQVSMIAAQKFA